MSPLTLRDTTRTTKEDAHEVTFAIDGEGNPQEYDEETDGALPDGWELVRFWLRPLIGKDQRLISDSMMHADKKGASRVLAGTVARLKVVRSVVACENVQNESGHPVATFDEAAYDRAPAWLTEGLLAVVNEINGEAIPEEE